MKELELILQTVSELLRIEALAAIAEHKKGGQ